MSECYFCGEVKKLCDAHISPKSFNYLRLPDEPPSRLTSNKKGFRSRRSQIGVYDKNILCADCDRYIGILDGYAAKELLQTTDKAFYSLDGRKGYFEYSSCDPEKMIGFVLSMLWRAHISNHPFYQNVQLGPYAAKIKSYLREGAALPSNIGVNPTEFINTDKVRNRVPQLDPHEARHDGVRFWHFYVNRFCFYVRTDNRRAPKYDGLELEIGKPVRILARDFMQSKEFSAIQKTAWESV